MQFFQINQDITALILEFTYQNIFRLYSKNRKRRKETAHQLMMIFLEIPILAFLVDWNLIGTNPKSHKIQHLLLA